ncbi:MAG: hypothetical protein RLZZ488_2439 [Pseudomonadota bacterium]
MNHILPYVSVAVLLFQGCESAPTYKATSKPPVTKSKAGANAEAIGSEGASAAQEENVGQAQPPGENATPEEPKPVARPSCDDKTTVKSDVIKVLIPKNDPQNGGKQCPFGKDDNNATTNGGGKYTARIERRFDIAIPADRQVCTLEASSAQQQIEYDDHLFLNLNNHVLIASRRIPTDKFNKAANGFYLYDWAKIRGTQAEGQSKCADGVTCSIPNTQTTGTFSFKLSEEANKRIFESLAGQPLYFSMVLTGDDNPPVDCSQIYDITLDVSYTYIPK